MFVCFLFWLFFLVCLGFAWVCWFLHGFLFSFFFHGFKGFGIFDH